MRRIAFLLALLIAGCGGGGGGAPGPGKTEVLSWDPPKTWTDNTPLNPLSDIQHNEILCNDNGTFTDNDVVASVAGVDNGAVVKSFDLKLLRPYVTPYSTFVTVRVWAWDNSVSECSQPVWWEKGE